MKNIFSKKIWVLFIVFMPGALFSQDVPKIIQPSPSMAALFRFQDYPMDYSTGLPQISIPLYQVQSGSLNVPISISYHASGRKVYDQDGPVGLGWSLNAGGMISRVIHGAADFGQFIFPSPFKLDNITNYNDLAYLQRIMRYQDNNCGTIYPYYDSEYDVFSYSFSGHSGKFVFKDNNNVKTPVLLPFKPLNITPTNVSTPGAVNFDITDDKGVTYRFGAADWTAFSDEFATTGWNLYEIISADRVDTVSFIYTGGVETRRTISQTITYTDDWNMFNQGTPPSPNPSFAENTTQASYQVSRLSEIHFRQGKVKVNMVSGSLRIDNIQVFNLKNEVVKTVQFNRSYGYFQGEINNLTYFLNAVEIKDNTNTAIEKYSFEYYPIVSSDVNGPINVRYCDWWGYYNNSGQHDMLPKYSVPVADGAWGQNTQDIGNPYGNRQPNLDAAKSAVLKKITYPTGGNTEFIYELNKYITSPVNGIVQDGPGLRIYQMRSTDGSGVLNTRTFKYGIDECGYGFLDLVPDLSAFSNEILYMNFPGMDWVPQSAEDGIYRQRYFNTEFNGEISELAQRPIIYQQVTEYNGTAQTNIGKTVYSYDYAPWAVSPLFPQNHIYNYNYCNNPSLIGQVDYKSVDGIYQKVKSKRSTYEATTTEYIRGLHVQRRVSTLQRGWGSTLPPGSSTPQLVCSEQYAAYAGGQGAPIHGRAYLVYTYSNYRIEAGFKNLIESFDTLFNETGNLIATTSYSYNSKNLLSKTSTTTSTGETVSSEIKYPFNYLGNATLDQMVSLNMLSYPVEQIETKNVSTPIKAVRTNYLNFGTTPARIYPQTIEVKQGSNAYETRLRYHAYDDKGNVLTVSKEKDVLKTYIWGYNKTYPVAEVTGVDHAAILSAVATLNQSVLNNPASDQAVRDEIQKIRFAFPSTQVSGYTYKPLIGMTSQVDVNGKPMYYEYDAYGRLKVIRDMDNNIIKTFKYQYQSPTP